MKHSTIFIDKNNIDNLFYETQTFLNDFTTIFFNLYFANISVADLITNEEIKKYLHEAEEKLSKKEFHFAIINIGKAFYELEKIETDLKD